MNINAQKRFFLNIGLQQKQLYVDCNPDGDLDNFAPCKRGIIYPLSRANNT